jgi:hypothetical protein
MADPLTPGTAVPWDSPVRSPGDEATEAPPAHYTAAPRSRPRNRRATRRTLGFLLARVGRAGVFGIDWLLRRWYGVYEFSRTDEDLLRISIRTAKASLVLSDGTPVVAGDRIIDLHIWNERVATLGALGPSLAWASRAKRRVERSLTALARHMDQSDDLDRCIALRAVAIFAGGRAAGKVTRIAARYGLSPPLDARRADLGHGLLAWGLAWACNPESLVGKRLKPMRYEFWMSSPAFRNTYLNGKSPGNDGRGCNQPSELPRLDITTGC